MQLSLVDKFHEPPSRHVANPPKGPGYPGYSWREVGPTLQFRVWGVYRASGLGGGIGLRITGALETALVA